MAKEALPVIKLSVIHVNRSYDLMRLNEKVTMVWLQ